MNLLTWIIVTALACSSALAAGTKQTTRKIASGASEMQIRSVVMDRSKNFRVLKNETGYQIILNSEEVTRTRNLTQADGDFIFAEFKNLPSPPKIPDDCYRSRVDIVVTGVNADSKSSCIGVTTVTSEAYERFIGILNLAL